MLILSVFASPLVPRVEEWGPAAPHFPFVGMLPGTSTHYTGCGKSRFTLVTAGNIEFIRVLLFINYCITFHTHNCKPTFAPSWNPQISKLSEINKV